MTRQQRLHDLLQAIADWRGARGAARLRARRNAMAMLIEWRMLVVAPKRAAFERAAAQQREDARAMITDDEIERLHDEGSAAAEHAWIGNIPPNPYRDDRERAEIWQHAFCNAYVEINH